MRIAGTHQKIWLLTALTALGYMGVLWFLFSDPTRSGIAEVMSVSFLLLVPFVTGALINFFAPRERRGTAAFVFGYPSLYPLLALSIAFIVKIEGIICVLMAAPVFAFMSSLGAMAFWLVSRRIGAKRERGSLMGMLLLPVVAGPIEGSFEPGVKGSVSESRIVIAASADTVWKNIIRVPKIGKKEIPLGLSALMGFPDPVEATLSHEGIGGVRRANFEGNVVFTETIDAWQENQKLSFSIVANTEEIPPTTMDEHMIVGGEYFDVLRGTYEIEDLGGGKCLLRLTSHHVAVSHVNIYADLWGRILMRDIQNRILEVIRKRCETSGSGEASTASIFRPAFGKAARNE